MQLSLGWIEKRTRYSFPSLTSFDFTTIDFWLLIYICLICRLVLHTYRVYKIKVIWTEITHLKKCADRLFTNQKSIGIWSGLSSWIIYIPVEQGAAKLTTVKVEGPKKLEFIAPLAGFPWIKCSLRTKMSRVFFYLRLWLLQFCSHLSHKNA